MDVELEIQMTDNNVAELSSRVEELEDELAKLQKQNADMLVVMQSFREALFLVANGQVEKVTVHNGTLKLKIIK